MRYGLIFILMLLLGMILAGCSTEPERTADPNTPELISFLEPAEPNIVRDFGDTPETQKLYNLIKLRAMVQRDEKIMAIMAKRLIALEEWQKERPPFAKKKFDTEIQWCVGYEFDPNGVIFGMPIDPNEVKE